MEVLKENPLLDFHPDTLEAVRKLYNLDKPGVMREAIDILDSWIKQQNHFTKKDFNRDYLERYIIRSKGSVERAKDHLDKMCASRTLVPHFFSDCDVNSPYLANMRTKETGIARTCSKKNQWPKGSRMAMLSGAPPRDVPIIWLKSLKPLDENSEGLIGVDILEGGLYSEVDLLVEWLINDDIE